MGASLHFRGVESPATREVQNSRTCHSRSPRMCRRDRSTRRSKMHAEAVGRERRARRKESKLCVEKKGKRMRQESRGSDAVPFTCVMKFGGSALASAERMREVAQLVVSFPDENPVVVHLCSMGKTTNNLLLAGEKAVGCGVSNASEIEELSFIKQRHLRLAHSANKQENSFKTFPVALSQGENLKFLTFVGGKGKFTYFLIEGFQLNGAARVAVPFMYLPYSGPRHVSPLQVSTIFKSPRRLLHPKLVASEARGRIQLIRSGPDEYQ